MLTSIRLTFLCAFALSLEVSGQITGASRVLSNAAGENARYSGVGRFRDSSTCTAFFVRTTATPNMQTPAYVLTNGHCLSDREANSVVLDKPLTEARMIFQYFADTQDRQVSVPAPVAAYTTMKGRDIAVIRLEPTFQQLVDRGIVPLEIQRDLPAANEAVALVGAPVADIPSDEWFLRRSGCELGPPVNLVEFVWRFNDAFPNLCSDAKGGASGSPLISERSGAALAILTTTTAGAATNEGDFRCYLNQPCEVVEGAVRYRTDTNYALPLQGLERCFDSTGVFQVGQEGCPLDQGRQLRLSAPDRAKRPFTVNETGQRVASRWNVELSGDAYRYYRYKTVAEASRGECRDPGGYGGVFTLSEKPVIDEELPPEPERYYLCVLGGNTPAVDERWQEPRFASVVHTRIDDSRPGIPITYQWRETDRTYVLTPYFVLPDLVSFDYKLDTAANSSCENPDGYRTYIRVPVQVEKTSAVNRVCLYGQDEAGNRSATLEFPVRGTSLQPNGIVSAASFASGPLVPGSIFSILGVNLAAADAAAPASGPLEGLGGMTVEITDSAGRRAPVPLFYVSRGQINALVPERMASGPAQVTIAGPNGPATAAVTIGGSHPGLFTAAGNGFGPPAGMAVRSQGGSETEEPLYVCGTIASCVPRAIERVEGSEALVLKLPITGVGEIAIADLDVRLGTERVRVTGLDGGVAPGTRMLRVMIGPDFPLRGYLPLTVSAAGRASNRLFVLLK